MANYRESSVAGTQYRRAGEVVISNGLEKKSIQFIEQDVVVLDGTVVVKHGDTIDELFTLENAATPFDLLNPETGEVLGSMTYQDLYVGLHSLYLHLATTRDLKE